MDQGGMQMAGADGKGVTAEQKEKLTSLKKQRKFYYYALVFKV